MNVIFRLDQQRANLNRAQVANRRGGWKKFAAFPKSNEGAVVRSSSTMTVRSPVEVARAETPGGAEPP